MLRALHLIFNSSHFSFGTTYGFSAFWGIFRNSEKSSWSSVRLAAASGSLTRILFTISSYWSRARICSGSRDETWRNDLFRSLDGRGIPKTRWSLVECRFSKSDAQYVFCILENGVHTSVEEGSGVIKNVEMKFTWSSYRIESDQKKFDSTRIQTNSTRLDSTRCNHASPLKYSLVLIGTRLEFWVSSNQPQVGFWSSEAESVNESPDSKVSEFFF